MKKLLLATLSSLILPFYASAELVSETMAQSEKEIKSDRLVVMRAIDTNGVGKIIGILKIKSVAEGIEITPDLAELSPGAHGFHLHENPSCEAGEKNGQKVAGLTAGGHYDLHKTGKHEGPHGAGHEGDLTILMVAADGGSEQTIYAPKLRLEDVINRSFIIHANSDNYSDMPALLGGSGTRVACGIVE